MVIVKLIGGLGNQMFQYAAARRLAHVHKTDVKLDLGWFASIADIDTNRRYELGPYRIRELFALPEEVERFTRNSFLKKLSRRFPFIPARHVVERHYHFDPRVLRLPDDVYLEGYWQTPKYFGDIREILLEDFSVKTGPDKRNRLAMDRIEETVSVSVHVRRGDYISNPAASSFHGICPMEYYQEAVKRMTGRVGRPHFFIFSDEPAWARENLTGMSPRTVIDLNGPDKGYEDMRLMSLCKHHIIANSSFSWWGAWLSRNPGKIVIAPGGWFKDPAIDTSDLVPETWTRI